MEFRNNPENFHPCIYTISTIIKWADLNVKIRGQKTQTTMLRYMYQVGLGLNIDPSLHLHPYSVSSKLW